MQTDENVVLFPGMKQASPPQSLDEIRVLIQNNKQEFTNNIAAEMTNYILSELQSFGYPMDSDDISFVCSVHMFYQSIRAVLQRMNGTEHELHKISEDLYTEEVLEQQKLIAELVDS